MEKATIYDFARMCKANIHKCENCPMWNYNCTISMMDSADIDQAYELPPYSQIIQPYEYGHPYTKRTCLWLKGLEKLKPTNIIETIGTFCPSGSYSNKHGEQHKGLFTKNRAKERSKTFPGIAKAMAEQWG